MILLIFLHTGARWMYYISFKDYKKARISKKMKDENFNNYQVNYICDSNTPSYHHNIENLTPLAIISSSRTKSGIIILKANPRGQKKSVKTEFLPTFRMATAEMLMAVPNRKQQCFLKAMEGRALQ